MQSHFKSIKYEILEEKRDIGKNQGEVSSVQLKILRSNGIKWFKKRVLNKIKMYDLKQYS